MLRTRLWMGAILIALTLGMLVVDQHLMPWAPFLFVFMLGLTLAACPELLALLGPKRRPQPALCYVGLLAIVTATWVPHLVTFIDLQKLGPGLERWQAITDMMAGYTLAGVVFVAVVMTAFILEMARFHEPGHAVERVAFTNWVVGYLGLIPSWFAQLRWLGEAEVGTAALALAIFVPKMCDSGAYFTGRLLGRHKMTPVLSPKKTWEGMIGGLAAAVLTAILIDRLGPAPVLQKNIALEIGFGLTVGVASMLGDLAESLIKRDCGQKDASQIMPGFGGVLDVVDSVILAAPVAYFWLFCTTGN